MIDNSERSNFIFRTTFDEAERNNAMTTATVSANNNRNRGHKLLTKAVAKTLPKFYSTENVPTDEKIVRVKFFSPYSNWTWYGVEYDSESRTFFGLVDGFEREWGYFSLDELEGMYKGDLPLVERDLYFTPKTIADTLTIDGVN